MQFDTKIAVVIRNDLEPWQKLNVASFLAGGIAAAFPESIGENYADGSGTNYLALIGQPILIYGADRPALSRALERALARNVTPAVYTEDMFRTTHDAANREVVKAVIRAELNLVGLAMRAERKVIDKIIDGLKFHSGRLALKLIRGPECVMAYLAYHAGKMHLPSPRIASGAKQSIFSFCRAMDCFAALAKTREGRRPACVNGLR